MEISSDSKDYKELTLTKTFQSFLLFLLKTSPSLSACVTNELGPARALKCKFPFNSGRTSLVTNIVLKYYFVGKVQVKVSRPES